MKQFTAALCLLLILGLLAGCQSEAAPTTVGETRPGTTGEGFAVYVQSKGFTIKDATATDNLDGTATQTLLAVGENYQLEYFQICDEASAQRVYSYASNNYRKRVPMRSEENEVTGANFAIWTFNSGEQFYLLARVDTTILSCAAPVACREEVLAHAAALGFQ